MEFAQGCASSTILADKAEASITEKQLEEAISQRLLISSKEGLLYYQIFKSHFTHPDAAKLVGKWQGILH